MPSLLGLWLLIATLYKETVAVPIDTNAEYNYNKCANETMRYLKAYWINVESKADRANVMKHQLNKLRIPHERVDGTVINSIHIESFEDFKFKDRKIRFADAENAKYVVLQLHGWYDLALEGGYDNTNTPKELACYMSHLKAIYTAVHDNYCGNYALIFEDDLHLAHFVNYPVLAASAPSDFGTLQLFSNNPHTISSLVEEFRLLPNNIWKLRLPKSRYWSAGAYIINKQKWGPVIDKLVSYNKNNGKYFFSIIAGNESSCMPKICCDNGKFIHELPCFASSTGYQADAIVYEFLPSYTLRLPIFNIWPRLATNSSIQDVSSKEKVSARFDANKVIFDCIIMAFTEEAKGLLHYDKKYFKMRNVSKRVKLPKKKEA